MLLTRSLIVSASVSGFVFLFVYMHFNLYLRLYLFMYMFLYFCLYVHPQTFLGLRRLQRVGQCCLLGLWQARPRSTGRRVPQGGLPKHKKISKDTQCVMAFDISLFALEKSEID